MSSFIAVLLLALIHVVAGRIRFSQTGARSVWLSFAGVIGVAFVFVLLLPELAAAQTLFERESRIWPFALGAALYAAILIVV